MFLLLNGVSMMMLFVDTREQSPLWGVDNTVIERRKLVVGDYTSSSLLGRLHIERKSGIDLYSSLIHNHARFVREILRAVNLGIILPIFVECSAYRFIRKTFRGGRRLHCSSAVLAKVVATMRRKYGLIFVWCNGRADMQRRILNWLNILI